MTRRDNFNADIEDRWDLDLTPFSNDELKELVEELNKWINLE